MNSGDLTPSNHDQSEPASNEVQFALVIARMIDTVRNSPADLRQAVYDLARYKLQEQFTYADAKDIRRTQQALEAAIQGVEEFSRRNVEVPPPAPPPPQLSDPDVATPAPRSFPPPELISPSTELIAPIRLRPHGAIDSEPDNSGRKANRVPRRHLTRTAAMVAILAAILVAVQQREHLLSLVHNLPKTESKAAIEAKNAPAPTSNNPAPLPTAKPNPLRPSDYGVYAISNDALIELQLLPGRPPDIRVAVSAALKVPSRALLPNGHPKFIVFRRDAVSNISDRAEIRIMAKVAREFAPDVAGRKPNDGDDTWVIRNVSFPFRSSPVNDNPELYELHSEDPTLELTPGRYALVLKNQAYEFSVEGTSVDPRQCIERIVAANGTFYSDCRKP
jgi:hypothetical protein